MTTAGGHWRARWAFVIVMGIIALALAWLDGSPAAAGEASAGGATASRAKTVQIANFAFKPASLTVARGTRVTFSNTDGAPHTATRAGSFDTGTLRSGRSASVRFGRSGTFAYKCTIHPSMRGKIVVR